MKLKPIFIIAAIFLFTVVEGFILLACAEEQIVNGSTNVALVFDVYGASSGDPCLVEADITDWNLKYYVEGAAEKDVNNATAGTLGTHADNTIASLGDGLWWTCFPDTCFDGGVNTKVTCWLTHDANEFICPAITVLLTPDDYNSVSLVKNVDVKYVHGETPAADPAASIATLQAKVDGADVNITLVKAVIDLLPDAGALTTLQANITTLLDGVNVQQIDDNDVNDGSVTLHIKELDINNSAGVGMTVTGSTVGMVVTGSAGDAIQATAVGGNYDALQLTGVGSGSGLKIASPGSGGDGVTITAADDGIGISTSGDGVVIAGNTYGLYVSSSTTSGVKFQGATAAGSGHGLDLVGAGTGKGLNAVEIADIPTAVWADATGVQTSTDVNTAAKGTNVIAALAVGVLAVDPNGDYFMVHGEGTALTAAQQVQLAQAADGNQPVSALFSAIPTQSAVRNTVEWILYHLKELFY